MEFSKKLAVLSWAVALVLTTLSVVLPVMGYSIEGIHTALPYSWGEVTVMQGFYLWKAKNENRSKYAQLFVKEIGDKYGFDSALRMAETVLKE